jgi:hypothetical protein
MEAFILSDSKGSSTLRYGKIAAVTLFVVILGLILSGCTNSIAENPANYSITNIHNTGNTVAITLTDTTIGSTVSHWVLERNGKSTELNGQIQKITLPHNSEYAITLQTTTPNGVYNYTRHIKVTSEGII